MAGEGEEGGAGKGGRERRKEGRNERVGAGRSGGVRWERRCVCVRACGVVVRT